METSTPGAKPADSPVEKPGWFQRYRSLWALFTLGLLATFTSAYLLNQHEQRQLAVDKVADDRVLAMQRSLNACIEVLQFAGAFYDSSQQVEPEEFHLFISSILARHPEIQSLKWLPRVTAAERVGFERELRRLMRRRTSITEWAGTGAVRVATARDEYFPAMYVEPSTERGGWAGFDLFSVLECRLAMERARDTGLLTDSGWIHPPVVSGQERSQPAVFFFLPVYNKQAQHETQADRRRALTGFLAAAVPLQRLLEGALQTMPRDELDIYLEAPSQILEPATLTNYLKGLQASISRENFRQFLSTNFPGLPQKELDGFLDGGLPVELRSPVFHFGPVTEQTTALRLTEIKNRRGIPPWEGALEAAGQTWNVLCFPTTRFFTARRQWGSWLVLVAGLVLTFLVVNQQRLVADRAAFGEHQVKVRTAELQRANADLKQQIAERERAEQALAHERDLLHTLLDNVPDRIYFKDAQSRFLRISRALAGLFGLKDPSEAVGKTDFDFFTEEHARPAFEDEQQIIRTGQPVIGRVELETLPDGRTCWAHTTKMPLRDKEGRIVGTFGISRDITSLKQMEEALAAERNLLSSIIAHLPDYVFVKDRQGKYLVNNPTHARLLGFDNPEKLIGLTAFDVYEPQEARTRHEDDMRIMETGQPVINREEPMKTRDGQTLWFLTTKVPLKGPDGRIVGLVCIGRDITARRQMEEELKKANAALQKTNEELRTTQMGLMQAEKLQSVGRLAAGVAHEVKNPLAILGMGIDYLSTSTVKTDPNVQGVIEDMRAAIQRADNIILGLLDFAAPHELKMAPADLHHIIQTSLKLTKHEQINSLVEVRCELAEPPPLVVVDANKITQVFVNLFLNALQAMKGGGLLTVRTYYKTLQPGEFAEEIGTRRAARFNAGETVVVVEVDDTGPGIPPDKLPRVWDLFFTTKPTGEGTGLGLSVARNIMELHQGYIDLKNRPEGGVRVTLWFKTTQP